MGKKVITVSLSKDSIDKAIKELKEYKTDIQRKTELFRQKVAEYAAKEAQLGFNGAVVDDLTGQNAHPIMAQVQVSTTERGNVSVVIADGEDAVWVEFGAGVYHNGSAGSSPHPRGSELGMIIGSYGKGNGRKRVWGYYTDENKTNLRLTHGTPARMPMSTAMNRVINDIMMIAKEVFK